MIRWLWFFAKIAVLASLAVWVANRPGTVAIDWLGYEITAPVGILFLAVLVLVALLLVLQRSFALLRQGPRRLWSSRGSRRREQGYRALTRGLVAVAAGDADTAARLARQAESLLNDPPLTLLLSAQAAQLNGDETAARRYFEAMLDAKDTRFLGRRGLLTQALKRQDRPAALEHAREARALQPKSDWVLRALFELEVQAGAYDKADTVLQDAVRIGALPVEQGRDKRVALLIERARSASDAKQALDFARRAHKLDPQSIPAAARYGVLLGEAGQGKRAAAVIRRLFETKPHADLAEAWETLAPQTTPAATVAWMQTLAKSNPGALDAQLAVARTAIRAGIWGEARAWLTRVEAAHGTARVYRLFAELEQAQSNDAAAADAWLVKAANAPADRHWHCRDCGHVVHEWVSTCPHCEAFASLALD